MEDHHSARGPSRPAPSPLFASSFSEPLHPPTSLSSFWEDGRGNHDSNSGEEPRLPEVVEGRTGVDLAHLSSPIGPAASVCPKGYCQPAEETAPRQFLQDPLPLPSTNTNMTASSAFAPGQQQQQHPRKLPPTSSSAASSTSEASVRLQWRHQQQLSIHASREQQKTELPIASTRKSAPASIPSISSSKHHRRAAVCQPQEEQQNPKRQKLGMMIEISPGVYSRLRGAQETRDCILQDWIRHSQCFSCGLKLLCIQDVSYVLCPECRMVSPLVLDSSGDTNYGGGVGLGVTMENFQDILVKPSVRNSTPRSKGAVACNSRLES